jgi:hypothetical protein
MNEEMYTRGNISNNILVLTMNLQAQSVGKVRCLHKNQRAFPVILGDSNRVETAKTG